MTMSVVEMWKGRTIQLQRQVHALQSDNANLIQHVDSLESELASLRSWDGLIELLNDHWPAETFNGSSGDPGPTIVALIRVIDGLQQDNASLRAAVEAVNQEFKEQGDWPELDSHAQAAMLVAHGMLSKALRTGAACAAVGEEGADDDRSFDRCRSS